MPRSLPSATLNACEYVEEFDVQTRLWAAVLRFHTSAMVPFPPRENALSTHNSALQMLEISLTESHSYKDTAVLS